jgi:hypothetical protein
LYTSPKRPDVPATFWPPIQWVISRSAALALLVSDAIAVDDMV